MPRKAENHKKQARGVSEIKVEESQSTDEKYLRRSKLAVWIKRRVTTRPLILTNSPLASPVNIRSSTQSLTRQAFGSMR
jgi:hypothetical protein